MQKRKTHITLVSNEGLRPYWMQYIASIVTACRKCGCDFINFNKMDALKGPAWMFYDHLHLNAQGTSHVANRIRDWAHHTTNK